jgi:MarR family transcriptional regulator, organic hydroperoxide resistance regulator
MPQKPLTPTISFLLGYTCKALHNAAENALASVGLYAGQEQCLSTLWEEEGLTQVELAQRMCVRPPKVNKMLTRLEAAGLVERRLDPEDNRFSRVYLTKKSRNVKQEVEQAFSKLEERVVANLSPEEQILLKRLLIQVHENLKES